jgi:hypothetical protein
MYSPALMMFPAKDLENNTRIISDLLTPDNAISSPRCPLEFLLCP